MPFQSEKQRRYLHANHPEIAKRWERDYADGGITRIPFFKGAQADTAKGQAMSPGTSASGGTRHGGGGGNGGDGPPSVVHKPTGPTAEQIAAAKAKAEAEKRRLEAEAHKKHLKSFKDTQTKKVKLKSKWDTPKWVDTDRISISLEDLKPKKTLDDYYYQLDETDVPLSDWEQQHLQELEKKNQLEFEDEFKKKENISNEKLMYPPPGNLAKLEGPALIQMRTLEKKKALEEYGGPTFTPQDQDTLNKLQKMDVDQNKVYKMPLLSAEGGVARKKYSTGGILDITGEEEITTEEGNDISLVDENETGVSTLFRAKDGGTPQLAKKSKDGTRPGYRGSDWASDNQNDFSGIDSGGWDPGVSSLGTTSSGGNVNTGSGDQEDDVAQMMHDMSITPDHSPNYTGSDLGWVVAEDDQDQLGGTEYIGPKDKVRIHNEILNRKTKYDSPLEQGKRAFGVFRSVPKPTGIPFIDLPMFGWFAIQQNKKKNERIAQIDEDLALLDKIGATKYTPHTDTLYQKLEQEKLDLTQPRSRDEDTGGDGPEVPVVAPVTEEIEDSYAMVGDWLQSYRDLKAKQALSASLQEKWADEREWQQNTMFANSGGLANLFRVKNY